jgi:uncharacterized protein YacL
MYEVIKSILDYLISNYALYIVITMGVIVSLTIAFLSLIKKPIKMLTAHIEKPRLRKFSNNTICISLSFGIASFIWKMLNLIATSYFPMEAITVLLTGALAVVIYALGDGVITKSTAQQLVEQIKDINDEITEPEKNKDPIKDFWKKVK